MIITRTPFRISFAGGGTDLPAFYHREHGAVVSTAIDKYVYITVNKKFDNKIRASYSVTEIVDHIDDLKHELIREALKMVGIDGGIEITSISDIPSSGTGLGSSSSYTVGLLNALYAYTGKLVNAERLAREACQIEIDLCRKPIGKQDQYIAAFGGVQHIRFNPDESVFVDPGISCSKLKDELQRHLIMLYTGVTRSANAILEEQDANTRSDGDKFNTLCAMRDLANELHAALVRGELNGFGEILHQGWQMKRSLASGISSQKIDEWYERARKSGAIGGKLLGAGGGGFLLVYAPPEKHESIIAALPELRLQPFRLEPQGSKIIYIE